MFHNIIIALLVLSTSVAHATWELDLEQSTLSFVSTKKAAIGEIGTFTSYKGTISDEGSVQLQIDLNSVNTNIAIRDDRLNNFLFQTDKHPTATLTGNINLDTAKELKLGQSSHQTVELELNLHGVSTKIKSEVNVIATETGYLVYNIKPVLLNANNFNLGEGINKLKELAKLDSISLAIPVNFNFHFVEK